MNEAYNSQDFDAMRKRPKRRSRTRKASPRKSGIYFYPNLDELLARYPIFTVNEYGEKVISGKRIC